MKDRLLPIVTGLPQKMLQKKSKSSTSKTSVELGGMTGGKPFSP
jgi:hypothetical protein